MIKISHESPLSMLEISRTYNDYDYALVHLFETHPEYYRFFEDSLNNGRKVLLDNSIFELGQAFDTVKYVEWINKLQPTEYIIPDVLEVCDETIYSAKKWMNSTAYHVHTYSRRIGVVQGTTYGELVKCYTALDQMGIDKIAKGTPNHVKGAIWYNQLLKHRSLENKYERITSGGKVKKIYIAPNKYNIDTLCYPVSFPPEFKAFEVDYVEMFDTLIKPPILAVYEAVGWRLPDANNETQTDLFSLFT